MKIPNRRKRGDSLNRKLQQIVFFFFFFFLRVHWKMAPPWRFLPLRTRSRSRQERMNNEKGLWVLPPCQLRCISAAPAHLSLIPGEQVCYTLKQCEHPGNVIIPSQTKGFGLLFIWFS